MSTIALTPCLCVSEHCPSAYVPAHHHIRPKSWGGPTTAANLAWLCPNSHSAVHALLDVYVHTGGTPTWQVLSHFNAHIRDLAAQGWAQRPSDHPPLTS